MAINKLPNGTCNIELNSVYDTCSDSIPQLVYKTLNKMNELITNVNNQNLTIEWLTKEGLTINVNKVMDQWLTDGIFTELINGTIFKEFNDKLTQFGIDLSKETGELKVNVNGVSGRLKIVEGKVTAIETEIEKINNKLTAVDNELLGKNPLMVHVVSNFKDLKGVIDVLGDSGNMRTIVLKEGYYEFESEIIVPSNIEIIGCKGSVLRWKNNVVADNVMFVTKQDNSVGLYNGAKNVTFKGLTFDGQDNSTNFGFIATGHAENILIDGCTFYNFNNGWHCIELNSTLNGKVINCNFLSCNTSVTGTEIIQLDLAYNSTTFPWGGLYDGTPCENILIERNNFQNITSWCVGSHVSKEGVRHNNIKIINNTIKSVSGFIRMLDYENVIVYGNKADKVTTFLLVNYGYSSSDNVTVVNNYHKGTFDSGGDGRFVHVTKLDSIQCKDWVISNNQVEECSGNGMGLTGTRFVVDSNIIINCQWSALIAYGLTHSTISNNIMKFSKYRDNTKTSYGDITIGGNTDIENNHLNVTGNVFERVVCRTADKTVFMNNIIEIPSVSSEGVEIVNSYNNFVGGVYKATGTKPSN